MDFLQDFDISHNCTQIYFIPLLITSDASGANDASDANGASDASDASHEPELLQKKLSR